MELEYLHTKPGDVVITLYEGMEDEEHLLIYEEGDDILIALDGPEYICIEIPKSQVNDLIDALKTVKEM